MSPVLDYQNPQIQYQTDPDGTLHITIPPRGWHQTMRIKSARDVAILAVFVFVLLAVPPVVFWFVERDSNSRAWTIGGILVLEFIVCMILLAGISLLARLHARVRVTATDLRIETFGAMDSTTLQLGREEIEFLDARCLDQEDRTVRMYILRMRFDMPDSFLGYLPEAEVRQITLAIREKLNFQTGERAGILRTECK